MSYIYIPTSSLNFNNILSTESLSPHLFYTKRDFGFKRFSKIPQNPHSNMLIGYSKIPKFQIPESNLDDYPMIIGILKDALIKSHIFAETEKEGIQIFQLNKTIYLNPKIAQFLFFKNKEKHITLIKAEPSIETKLVPIYRDQIKLIDTKEHDCFNWTESFNIDVKHNDKELEYIKNDVVIDKLKGFYYSYVLGIILKFITSSKFRPTWHRCVESSTMFNNTVKS